jgi:hypothetical protein
MSKKIANLHTPMEQYALDSGIHVESTYLDCIQGKVINLPLECMIPHPEQQRKIIPTLVNAIRLDFTWSLFGMPTVVASECEPYHYVLDGNHRVTTAKTIYPQGIDENGNPIIIGCIIPFGATLLNAWQQFVGLNGGIDGRTRKSVNRDQVFEAMYRAQQPVQVRVTALIRSIGLDIHWPSLGTPRIRSDTVSTPSTFGEWYRLLQDKRFRDALRILRMFLRADDAAADCLWTKTLTRDFLVPLGKAIHSCPYPVEVIMGNIDFYAKRAHEIIAYAGTPEAREKYGQDARSGYGFREIVKCLLLEIFNRTAVKEVKTFTVRSAKTKGKS